MSVYKTSLPERIGGKLTLWGIYNTYKKELQIPWKAEDTKSSYERNYSEVLAPLFSERAFEDYTSEDVAAAFETIRKAGYQTSENAEKRDYSKATLDKFKSNIRSIDRLAVKKGIREISIFWGSVLDLSDSLSEDEQREQEYVLLQKSLTPEAEKAVFNQVMDPAQDGEYMGVALMYGLGLRNGEACGTNFSDIRQMEGYPDFWVLYIYKITKKGTNRLTASGKTRNADRLIPVPQALLELLQKRKQYLKTKVNPSENVDDYPIVCVGQEYAKRCTVSQLSTVGKKVLRKAHVKSQVLSFIEKDIIREARLTEKDPTAYLFRRNYATMLHILGLSTAEIQYIIGHNIESATENRNSYNNPDKLYPIKLKMDNRPLFSTTPAFKRKVTLELGSMITFQNPYAQEVCIPKEICPCKVVIHVEADAPNSALSFRLDSKEPVNYEAYMTMIPRANTTRTASVMKLLQDAYEKGNGKGKTSKKSP